VLVYTITFPVDNDVKKSINVVEGDEESTCLVESHNNQVSKDGAEEFNDLPK